MTSLINDLPGEILVEILKFVEFSEIVDNCLWTCVRWYDVVIDYFLRRYLNRLSESNEDMKQALFEQGWNVDPNVQIDQDLIISLYGKYSSFNVVIATGEPYGCGQKTEMIDFLKLNQGNERLLNTPRCYGCSGELIQGQPVIFGGYRGDGSEGNENERDYYQYCLPIMKSKSANPIKMIKRRYRPSSVILQNGTAWIVGGSGNKSSTKSSEFVNLETGAREGPELPFEAWGHSMIKYSDNCFYIIGGQQDKILSNKTWIVTPKSKKCTEFEFTEGPTMNIPRRGHACGKFEKDGKIVIIVAGGYDQSLQDLDSIEYLIPSTGQGWKFGPKLPFFLAGAAMVTSPSGKGVILIGGYNADKQDYSKDIIELQGTSMQWVKLKQKLAYPRADLVAIPMPVKITSQRGERQSSRKRKARVLYQAGFI